MTAVPDWDIVDPRLTDAELVGASMAGDRAAFAQIYDRYADRLHDFCVGMLRDRDSAADCVQETFCTAATRLPQLREPDKLRPWLYSIARNEALRRLREWRRETPSEELPEIQSDDASPDLLSARTELADLIAEVAGGLTDRDQAVLDLAFRHGLDGPELAEALGVSHANANTMVVRLRRTIERSLGALLVSRRARNNADGCRELREILAGWDGQFTILVRKRVSRHIESCPICDEERRRLVSPAALLGATPVFIPAPAWLREKTLNDVQLTSHGNAMAGESGQPADGQPDHAGTAHTDGAGGGRRRMMVAALLVAELGAATGLLLTYVNKPAIPITPSEVSETATPAPTNTQPTATLTQAPPQVPMQPPLNVTPPAPTPRSGPTPAILPTILAPLPDPGADAPPAEGSLPRVPPSTKPPMSFTPTVVVVPPEVPDSDGGGDPGRREGSAPPGVRSPAP